MLNVMVQSDLENIDYDTTCLLNGGFELSGRDLYGEFKFALKDGRIFKCEQDLNEIYTAHSDTEGGIVCDLWGQMAFDYVFDLSKFIAMVKTLEETVQNLEDYLDDVKPEEVVKHKMVDIAFNRYGLKGTIIKLVTMGLENKYGVTIEQVR